MGLTLEKEEIIMVKRVFSEFSSKLRDIKIHSSMQVEREQMGDVKVRVI